MQTHLYIHKEDTGIPQPQYRGKYPLKHFDYGLSRNVGRKGEITSGVCGGEIRIVIDGFADATMLGWLFDTFRQEDGTIVTLDEQMQWRLAEDYAKAWAKYKRLYEFEKVKKSPNHSQLRYYEEQEVYNAMKFAECMDKLGIKY